MSSASRRTRRGGRDFSREEGVVLNAWLVVVFARQRESREMGMRDRKGIAIMSGWKAGNQWHRDSIDAWNLRCNLRGEICLPCGLIVTCIEPAHCGTKPGPHDPCLSYQKVPDSRQLPKRHLRDTFNPPHKLALYLTVLREHADIKELRLSLLMVDSTSIATVILLASASALLLAVMLYPAALLRWFQRKRYQYEVTFSLYMLTSTEKFIFSAFAPLEAPHPGAGYGTTDMLIMCYYRLRTLPPPLAPYNRRIAIPPRSPHNYCEPLVLLLLGQ